MSDHRAEVPAFPIVHPDGQGVQFYGMSLRDYFAAKYMQAHVAGWLANDNDYPNRENVAAYAYLQADAMLKERAK